MTDIQRAARTVTAAKLLSDVAKAEAETARAELAEHMRCTGTERVRVSGDAGENLGAVSLAQGRLSARVVDEAAFDAWAADRYPSERVMTVRPAFRERLLSTMAKLGDPVDPDTGEVVPGVELVRGEPYLTVRPTNEARERMSALLASTGLLELETGDAAS